MDPIDAVKPDLGTAEAASEEMPSSSAAAAGDVPADVARRAAMLKLGYAACVAPAMLVLTTGKSRAVPDCDVPAWDLGLKRAGHSGC